MQKGFKIQKQLFAIVLVILISLGMIPVISTSAAENYDGGWAFSKANHTVYNAPSGGSAIGSIGREGITVLSRTGNVYYIEYSTSNGPKRGYIRNPNLDTSCLSSSCVAKITIGSNLYYGPNTSIYAATGGSVSAGEYVSVISKENNWVYVEYNTNSGRKRGYMPYANLSCYNRPTYFADFYMSGGKINQFSFSEPTNVYFGPNDANSYATVGYVDSSDGNVPVYYSYYYGNGEVFHYVEYMVNGKYKSGFIRWDLY